MNRNGGGETPGDNGWVENEIPGPVARLAGR